MSTVFEYLLNPQPKQSRQFERQGQTRIELPRLDRIDRLPRHLQPQRQISLRPVPLRAQNLQPVLHRYLSLSTSLATTVIPMNIGKTNISFRPFANPNSASDPQNVIAVRVAPMPHNNAWTQTARSNSSCSSFR